jgi:hypothetical protein
MAHFVFKCNKEDYLSQAESQLRVLQKVIEDQNQQLEALTQHMSRAKKEIENLQSKLQREHCLEQAAQIAPSTRDNQACISPGVHPRQASAEKEPGKKEISIAPDWELSIEENEELREIFSKIDADGNLKVRKEELDKVEKNLDTFLFKLSTTWDEVLASESVDDKDLTLDAFKTAVKNVRELARKVQSLSLTGVHRAVAACIAGGSPGNPLMALSSMTVEEIKRLCQDKIAPKLTEVLQEHAKSQLQCSAAAENVGGNTKFAAQALVYGEIEEYYEGLEAMLGFPNPNLLQAMEHEHCQREDSMSPEL